MAKYTYRLKGQPQNLEDLVRQLVVLFNNLEEELNEIKGYNGATFQNNSVLVGLYGTDATAQASNIADATTSHTVTDPADTPASADALRDDLVANTIPSIESALNAQGTTINSIISALEGIGISASS